ncbi:larval/pupal cuticle protein H1C-like [Ostrinia nubilalis]|uniref:larval/pupal cuticle protein H1C-like n=1 Tax=Ostrinia nubilalis TaxID=29057 RepID=UPI0010389683|nr:larval/pupal cuticle protein H1C-like isoform X2 [Ostrinia furnacalis]
MRFLIVAAAVLACAAAAPSGALLAGPYAHGYAAPLAVAHAAPLALAHAPVAVAHAAPALPTISPGDIHAAAIDAHVDASDHARAAVDAAREIQGQAINAAEDHSWQALDAVKTQQAALDGAAAGVSPILAKQIAGHAAYAAPVVAHAAPVVAHGYAAHAAPVLAHAPAVAYGASHSVVSQSLSQSHPAPIVHAPVAYAHGVHGLAHGYSHAW